MHSIALSFAALAASVGAQIVSSSTRASTATATASQTASDEVAQSSSTQPSASPSTTSPPLTDAVTGRIILDYDRPVEGFDASLICGDSTDSTYVLQCASTSAPNSLCQQLGRVAITITANPTAYELLYTSRANGGAGTVTQICDFGGPSESATSATCSLSGWVGAGGRSVQITSTIETIGTESFPPIATFDATAGGDNAGAETCAATSSSSAPDVQPTGEGGQESASANDVGRVAREVYKVLVPIGIVAALVGI